MKHLVVFLLMAVVVPIVHAGTYEWVDSGGVTHFTDDPDRVPAKYRKRVRERESMKVDMTAPEEKTGPVVEKPAAPAQRAVFGGHDERWWRSAFNVLRTEQKTLQNGLPGKKEQLTTIRRRRIIYQKASYREAYNKLNQEIANDEVRIKELQDKLDALDRDAGTAGVPAEWRQ